MARWRGAALLLAALAAHAVAAARAGGTCGAVASAAGDQRDIMTAGEAERALLAIDSFQELRETAVAMLRAGCADETVERGPAENSPDFQPRSEPVERARAAAAGGLDDELTETQRREWRALADLYEATGGDGGGLAGHGWSAGSPVAVCDGTSANSSWDGVLCDGNGRVASLLLFGRRLAGTLPASLSALTEVVKVDVSDNRLSGTLPAEWSSWRRLARVEVNTNALSGTLPAEWASWPGVTHVLVGANRLEGTLPAEWSSWPRINTLEFNDNLLSGTLPAEWSNWTSIGVFVAALNRLSGTLPASYAAWPAIHSFSVDINRISGTLPGSYSAWNGSIHAVSVAGNLLSGTLPEAWSSWGSVGSVAASQNSLSGTLPPAWASMAALNLFEVQDNRLSGPLPAEWSSLAAMLDFRVGGNRLAGTLPAAWRWWAVAANVRLGGNLLSGTLPPEWSAWHVNVLRLDDNRLSGTLPAEWGANRNMYDFSISDNRLSGTLPAAWSSWGSIARFLADNNRLSGTLPVAWGFSWPVERLHLRNNLLTGSVPLLDGHWNSALELYLDRNRFSGALPHSAWSSSLERVNLSSNLLSGTLPDIFDASRNLFLVHLVGNANLTGCLPPSLLRTPAVIEIVGTALEGLACYGETRPRVHPSPRWRTEYPESGLLSCPMWISNGELSGAVAAPAAFLGYDRCRCGDGSVWDAAELLCRPCPAAFVGRARCDPFVLAPRHCLLGDQYPARRRDGALARDLSAVDEVALLQCRRPGLCNAGSLGCAAETFADAELHTPLDETEPLQFSCAAGHDRESLMCSRCEDGHWRNGDACLGCPASFVVLVPLVTAAMLAFLGWYLWRKSGLRHDYYRTLGVALFWLQVTHLLEESAQVQGAHSSTSTWQWVAAVRATLESWAVFNPLAAQCVHGGVDFVAQSYAVLLAPAAMGLLGAAAVAVVRSKRLLYVALYALLSLFLPVVTRALQVLRCESQLGSVSYVSAAPYVLCDDPRLLPLRVVAGLVLALYAVPAVAVVWRAPWRHTHAPRPASSRPLETLSRPLMDGDDEEEQAEAAPSAPLVEQLLLVSLRDPSALWWWPAAYEMGRSVSLALLVGLVPPASPLLPVGVFLVLSASALAHGRYLPARMASDAVLEMAVLTAAMAVYLLSILGGAAAARSNDDSAAFRTTRALVSLVHVAMLSALACGLAWPRYVKWRSRRRQ